jgi:hypothetical protein
MTPGLTIMDDEDGENSYRSVLKGILLLFTGGTLVVVGVFILLLSILGGSGQELQQELPHPPLPPASNTTKPGHPVMWKALEYYDKLSNYFSERDQQRAAEEERKRSNYRRLGPEDEIPPEPRVKVKRIVNEDEAEYKRYMRTKRKLEKQQEKEKVENGDKKRKKKGGRDAKPQTSPPVGFLWQDTAEESTEDSSSSESSSGELKTKRVILKS